MSVPFGADLIRILATNLDAQRTPSPTGHTSRQPAFSPSFDVAETETEYILEGEFAGLHDKSQIHIDLTDNQTLSIHGAISRSSHDSSPAAASHKVTVEEVADEAEEGKGKKVEEKNAKVKHWVSERSVGRFQRQFSFPSMIEAEGIKASLKDGLLTVVVPKKVQVGSRKIVIS